MDKIHCRHSGYKCTSISFHKLLNLFIKILNILLLSDVFILEKFLRATASKYRESADSEENSGFLLLRQKDPFGEKFPKIYFQSSSEFTFLRNLGKFKMQLNQPRWPMEFIQNCTFSTRQYRKMGTCLGFIFTQFVIYSLVILLS